MPVPVDWPAKITEAWQDLQAARASGDPLRTQLCEAGLNDILENALGHVTDVTLAIRNQRAKGKSK